MLDEIEVEPYEFVQTGEGCAEHGLPECLCDVVLDGIAPVCATNHVMFGKIAADLMVGFARRDADEFREWAGNLLALYEMARESEARAAAREEAHQLLADAANGNGAQQWVALSKAVSSLCHAGCSFREAALACGVSPQQAAAAVTMGNGTLHMLDDDELDLLETQVRLANLSRQKIGEQFDISRYVVANFEAVLGVKRPSQSKFGPAERAFLQALRDSGADYTEAAEKFKTAFPDMDVKRTTLFQFYKRLSINVKVA